MTTEAPNDKRRKPTVSARVDREVREPWRRLCTPCPPSEFIIERDPAFAAICRARLSHAAPTAADLTARVAAPIAAPSPDFGPLFGPR